MARSSAHAARRRRWVAWFKAGNQSTCPRCGHAVCGDDDWHLDHLDPEDDSTSVPSHKTCNERHGGHEMATPSYEGHEMQMEMHSTIDLADPMSREGSGTSWIPDSSPMYGRMFMFGDDMLMLHGAIFPREPGRRCVLFSGHLRPDGAGGEYRRRDPSS